MWGWGRRQGMEKKEEGREEKLSYKRGKIGCEEDFVVAVSQETEGKGGSCMRKGIRCMGVGGR